ncbi:MAG: hypothetical protein AAFN18_22645, partial [Cyanobacteria bacterium J06554_6]
FELHRFHAAASNFPFFLDSGNPMVATLPKTACLEPLQVKKRCQIGSIKIKALRLPFRSEEVEGFCILTPHSYILIVYAVFQLIGYPH